MNTQRDTYRASVEATVEAVEEDDVVKRLNDDFLRGEITFWNVLPEAADEIERLRAQLATARAKISEQEEWMTNMWAGSRARTAEAQLATARKALEDLCNEVAAEELHGDGAHDDGCSICAAHYRARAALNSGEQK